MPRTLARPRLDVTALGPIARASVAFGDLTVFVGPQAAGKTILFETLKLVLDQRAITEMLRLQGYDWDNDKNAFLDLYFGEGMSGLFSKSTTITWKGKAITPEQSAAQRRWRKVAQNVYYIPAHRALTINNGWPRHFGDYSSGDPYVVKEFSENLRSWMEFSGQLTDPDRGQFTATTRDLIQSTIFGDYRLMLERRGSQKRLILRHGNEKPLPYMVWSAGQREFGPLLLGLRMLLSAARRSPHELKWVVIEEPEMGLHPLAITAVLFIVLFLLERGFRVCLSTHSPHVLDLLWALRVLRERGADPGQVLKLFELDPDSSNRKIAAAALDKVIQVYSFDRKTGVIDDISRLDPDSANGAEVTWGGLVGFSSHVSDVVARFVANLRDTE